MSKISKQTLYDIKCEAKKHLESFKGKSITDEDLVFAENLMVFGYLRAVNELETSPKQTRTMIENLAIIHSQGDNL